MYDDDSDRSKRRPRAPLVAGALALLALGAAAFALVAEHRHDAQVSRLREELAVVEQRVRALDRRNETLVGRVNETEQTLARREAGLAPLAKRVLRSVFTVETDISLGSGFVAWRDGGASYLVTAAHVVEESAGAFVTVSRRDGSWTGEIAGIDSRNDLAVVRISGKPAGAEPLWQEPRTLPPKAGDELLLVGSPFGLEGSVSTGVVSRVTKRYIQTDAAANPGNSGGPALDKTGRIVGVLVSGGGENINFAVPIAKVCAKLRQC